MKKLQKKGMTLIEIIISIAILGIITIAFLNVFTSGYIGILSAGRHTEVGYEAQGKIENSIISENGSAKKMEIKFPGGVKVEVDGEELEKEVDNGKQSIKIKTFIPNP